MQMPKSVVINECWARDGLQNQQKVLKTTEKIDMLHQLVAVGFKRIEATSFSHPKYVPQFYDADQILERLPSNSEVQFKVTCVNRKALERAIEAKQQGKRVDEVSFVFAASEAYNLINVKKSNKELMKIIEGNIQMANEANIESVVVSVSTAFGYESTDDVTIEDVVQLVDYFQSMGVRKISVSDTTGMADPNRAYATFSKLIQRFPNIQFIAHFHDTKGWGIANCLAALQAGVTFFDTSLGGIGGPPAERMEQGQMNTGNVCTEDFVAMLDQMGIATGLDLERLQKAGRVSESLLGRQHSYTLQR